MPKLRTRPRGRESDAEGALPPGHSKPARSGRTVGRFTVLKSAQVRRARKRQRPGRSCFSESRGAPQDIGVPCTRCAP